VNAFVSGGLLPQAVHGTKLEGLGAVWDWYATFAELAGVDTTDHTAAVAGLPPVDSISLWPYISGARATSPRMDLPIGSTSCVGSSQLATRCVNPWGWGDVKTVVSGLIQDEGIDGIWKLLIGEQTMSGWQGPLYPNQSTAKDAFIFSKAFISSCGEAGCLFRIDIDPTEHHDLANTNTSMVMRAQKMLAALAKHNATVFSPQRGPGESDKNVINLPCEVAVAKYQGFFGPFLD